MEETYGTDREFFLELVELFITRFGDAPEKIRSALAQGDREAAARRVHALKGTAGSLGALELMAAAGELEQALVTGSPDPEPLVAQVGAHLASLRGGAQEWLGGEKRTPPAPGEAPPLDPSLLEELRTALAHNRLSALDLFAGLEPALAGVYGGRETLAIAEAIRELRFAKALRLLARSG